MKVDRLTDSIAEHGEGPVWSDAWGGLHPGVTGRPTKGYAG